MAAGAPTNLPLSVGAISAFTPEVTPPVVYAASLARRPRPRARAISRHRRWRAAVAPPLPTSGVAVLTVRRPDNNDGLWLRYDGATWVSGGAGEPRTSAFTQVGDYAGFPVFRKQGDGDAIYLETREGVLAPYRRKSVGLRDPHGASQRGVARIVLVVHPLQEQPRRGRGQRGDGFRVGLEERRRLRRRHLVLARPRRAPRPGAAPSSRESATPRRAAPSGPRPRARRTIRGAPSSTSARGSSSEKARKSWKPTNARAASRIRSASQSVLEPPHEGLGERRPAPGDLIDVAARDRVMAGVKPRRRRLDAQHVDVGGQRVVDPAAKRLGRQLRPDLEMRHLSERVHAGIGASRAVELEPIGCPSPRESPSRPRPARCGRSAAPASRCSGCRRIRA